MLRRGVHVLALITSLVALRTEAIWSGEKESRSPASPGPVAAQNGRGETIAAAGQGLDGTPFVLTVWEGTEGEKIIRSTTFVRGRTVLRIERLYRPEVGLEVTYAAGGERLRVVTRKDLDGEGVETLWTLPGGEEVLLRYDPAGGVIQGDAALLKELLSTPRPLFAALKNYAQDVETVLPSMAETVRFFPLKVPDPDCWRICALGCPPQCRLYCPTLFSCEVCMSSCYVGCGIGCM